jgi:hypothetical protein
MLKGIGSCDEPLVRAPQEDYHAMVLPPWAPLRTTEQGNSRGRQPLFVEWRGFSPA